MYLILTFVSSADTVLTDLPEALPLLEENANANAPAVGPVRVRSLRWGNEEDVKGDDVSHPDLVLVSDCVYYEDAVLPLVETLRDLSPAEVLISYEERHSEQKKRVQKAFWEEVRRVKWELFSEHFIALSLFQVEKYFDTYAFDVDDCHPDYASPDIKVIRMIKK